MLKLDILLKRKPKSSVEDFQEEWLQKRGNYLARQKEVRRYVQSYPLPLAYKNGEPVYDGLEELWFDDAMPFAAAEELLAKAEENHSLLATGSVTMSVREFVVLDGAPAADAIKSVILVRRKTNMNRDDFFSYWHNNHAMVAGRLPGMLRYEQNPVRDPDSGCAYDGISLAWFSSLSALKALRGTPQYADALQDEKNFLEDGGHLPIVLMREQVLVAG